MKRNQIVGLDLIRFMAAMAVVIFHFTYWIWAPDSSTPKRITGGMFEFRTLNLAWGWIGVQVFFVISGFVIAYSAASASSAGFLRSRILRLAPAAWICATITLAVVVMVRDTTLADALMRYARSVLFVPVGPWIDGVYWTLGIEIVFYALVLALISLRRLHWLEGVSGLMAAVSAVFWMGWLIRPDLLAPLADARLTALLLIRHGGEFSLGVVLWLILFQGATWRRMLIVGVAVLASSIEISAAAGAFAARAGVAAAPLPPLTFWALSVAALCAAVIFNDAFHRLLRGRTQTIRHLGLATYPLYLVHQLVGAALMAAFKHIGLPSLACVILAIACVVGFALLVAIWLEPPVKRMLGDGLMRIEPSIRILVNRLAPVRAS